ncbi:MAG: M48 family metalloprotease [Candidatus Eisenbacteria bacterium]
MIAATVVAPILGMLLVPAFVLVLAIATPRLRAPEGLPYQVRLERHRRIAWIDTIALLVLIGLSLATLAAILTSDPRTLLAAAALGSGAGLIAVTASRTFGVGVPFGGPPGLTGPAGLDTETSRGMWLDIVAEMAAAAGIAPPRFAVSHGSDANAYVWPARAAATVVVSQALVAHLHRGQAAGVIAHLVARVTGHDDAADRCAATLSSFISGVGWIVLGVGVPAMVWVAVVLGATGNASAEGDALLRIPLLVLVPAVVASAMLWAGRLVAGPLNVELVLLADAQAIAFTRDPVALASALDHINHGSTVFDVPKAARHLFIANPRVQERGRLGSARSAYPPIAERLERIRAGDA